MKSNTTKSSPTSSPTKVSSKQANQPFFQKQGNRQEAFFGKNTSTSQSFFSPTIQTKLTIGQPGDKYEQEADAMADKVVQRLAVGSSTESSPAIQAKCAACEQEDKVQKMEGEEALMNGEEDIQRKAIFESNEDPSPPAIQQKTADASPTTASDDLQSRLSATKGGGQPMSDTTLGSMNTAFGTDFGGVRIHTDNTAVQMNQELGAQAFTHGADVYFNRGKYDTESTGGQRLLAHELVHTVQQGFTQNKLDSKLSTSLNRMNKNNLNLIQCAREWEDASIRYISPNPFPDILLREFQELDVDGDVQQPIDPTTGPRFQTHVIGESSNYLAVWELAGANTGMFGNVRTAFTEGDTLERRDISQTGRTRIRFRGVAIDLFGQGRIPRVLEDHSNEFMVYGNRWQTPPDQNVSNSILVNENQIRDISNGSSQPTTIGRQLSQGWSISNNDSTTFSSSRSSSHSLSISGQLEGDIRGMESTLGADYGFEQTESQSLANTFSSGFMFSSNVTDSFSAQISPNHFGIFIPILRTRTLELPILNTTDGNGIVTGISTLRMLITEVIGFAVREWPINDEASREQALSNAREFRSMVMARPQDFTTFENP